MQLEVGSIVKGKVKSIMPFGAFIELDNGKQGMVHISKVSNQYVKQISDHLSLGEEVSIKVLSLDNNKVDLSIKDVNEDPAPKQELALSFEEMINKFKKDSEDKLASFKAKEIKRRK